MERAGVSSGDARVVHVTVALSNYRSDHESLGSSMAVRTHTSPQAAVSLTISISEVNRSALSLPKTHAWGGRCGA
jgi:hypothetical protein